MKHSLASVSVGVAAVLVAANVAGWAKSGRDCEAEWRAHKAAIAATSQKKKDFMAACRAGLEFVPSRTPADVKSEGAPEPLPEAKLSAARPLLSGVNQFAYEANAQARCPTDTVVWVDTKSRIYHFAGTRDYGNTTEGAYMCNADATAAGYRPARNEKHP